MCVTDKLPIVDFQLTIGGTYGAYTDGASRTNESICIAGLAGVSFAAEFGRRPYSWTATIPLCPIGSGKLPGSM